MVEYVTRQSEIPDAEMYVLCTDKFMSGWGWAENARNVLIFPCEYAAEAWAMVDMLERRPEMKWVRINYYKPRIKSSWFAQVKNPKEWLRYGR